MESVVHSFISLTRSLVKIAFCVLGNIFKKYTFTVIKAVQKFLCKGYTCNCCYQIKLIFSCEKLIHGIPIIK